MKSNRWVVCLVAAGLLSCLLPTTAELVSDAAGKVFADPKSTCADLKCPPDYTCYDLPGGPYCIPDFLCDYISCAEGYHCEPPGGCVPNDPPVYVSPLPVGGAVWLTSAFPNPARSELAIGFTLPLEGRVTLRIYDVSGRAVRTLVDGVRAAGVQSVHWDRRLADGAIARPGFYFCELRAFGQRRTRSLVLVR